MPGFPIKLSSTPARLRKPSPQVDEHTVEVLHELGYHDKEIQGLIQDRVVEASGRSQ